MIFIVAALLGIRFPDEGWSLPPFRHRRHDPRDVLRTRLRESVWIMVSTVQSGSRCASAGVLPGHTGSCAPCRMRTGQPTNGAAEQRWLHLFDRAIGCAVAIPDGRIHAFVLISSRTSSGKLST
jgi:hypothetical protein